MALLRIAVFFVISLLAPSEIAALSADPPIDQLSGSQFFEGGGFAWGITHNTFLMARTTDYGKTWKMLDLSGLQIDLDARTDAPMGKTPVSVHFWDSNHGWLSWSTHYQTLHLASTADGGASWSKTLSLDSDTVVDGEIDPGPGRSCILAEMPEGMQHTTMLMLVTDDNGATWTSSFFDQGDGVSGWCFRNATDGFVGVNYPSGVRILFYRSTDGGKSWQEVNVPWPRGVTADDVYGTRPETPVFSGSERRTGTMRIAIGFRDGNKNFDYTTSDGGKTWVCTQ